jgi:hypothetical protein
MTKIKIGLLWLWQEFKFTVRQYFAPIIWLWNRLGGNR